jgi:hypothetical protein
MHCSVSKETESASSHFYEMKDPATAMKSLTFSMISDIVSHPSLKVVSEDSLYDFIVSKTEDDQSFLLLLEFVRFEYLSTSKFRAFIELMLTSFDYFNSSLWLSLRSRLSLPVSPETSNDRLFVAKSPAAEFAPSSSSCLNGIIAHLTRRCGGNVHDRNVVTIRASSNVRGHADKYAADLEARPLFHSLKTADSWLCYDFKDMRIEPTHYTIRSYYAGGQGSYNLKNWVIEGSDDGDSWVELDRRGENDQLNARNATVTFTISRSQEVRLVRLRQTGLNHHGDHYILTSSFEVFGSLIE